MCRDQQFRAKIDNSVCQSTIPCQDWWQKWNKGAYCIQNLILDAFGTFTFVAYCCVGAKRPFSKPIGDFFLFFCILVVPIVVPTILRNKNLTPQLIKNDIPYITGALDSRSIDVVIPLLVLNKPRWNCSNNENGGVRSATKRVNGQRTDARQTVVTIAWLIPT